MIACNTLTLKFYEHLRTQKLCDHLTFPSWLHYIHTYLLFSLLATDGQAIMYFIPDRGSESNTYLLALLKTV